MRDRAQCMVKSRDRAPNYNIADYVISLHLVVKATNDLLGMRVLVAISSLHARAFYRAHDRGVVINDPYGYRNVQRRSLESETQRGRFRTW